MLISCLEATETHRTTPTSPIQLRLSLNKFSATKGLVVLASLLLICKELKVIYYIYCPPPQKTGSPRSAVPVGVKHTAWWNTSAAYSVSTLFPTFLIKADR